MESHPSPPSVAVRLNQLLGYTLVRYAAAGVIATLADIALFTFLQGWVFQANYYLISGFFLITRSHLSLICSYAVSMVVHFPLSKYFVFVTSPLKTGTQLWRYVVIALLVFIGNYYLTGVLYKYLEPLLRWQDEYSALLIRTTAAGLMGLVSFVLNRFVAFKA